MKQKQIRLEDIAFEIIQLKQKLREKTKEKNNIENDIKILEAAIKKLNEERVKLTLIK